MTDETEDDLTPRRSACVDHFRAMREDGERAMTARERAEKALELGRVLKGLQACVRRPAAERP